MRASAIAALEPRAAEHFDAMVGDVPGVVPQLAGEGSVQETPEFAFGREEAREEVEQEVVRVAQLLGLGLASTAARERIVQMQSVVRSGWTGNGERSGEHQDCIAFHQVLLEMWRGRKLSPEGTKGKNRAQGVDKFSPSYYQLLIARQKRR